MTTAAEARMSLRFRKQRREQSRRRWARQSAWAKEAMTDLIKKLGGVCTICEEDGANAPLTVDHKEGHGWGHRHNKINYYYRTLRYLEEYAAGVPLRVLCQPCNSGYRPPNYGETLPEAPF